MIYANDLRRASDSETIDAALSRLGADRTLVISSR